MYMNKSNFATKYVILWCKKIIRYVCDKKKVITVYTKSNETIESANDVKQKVISLLQHFYTRP